ncbi:stalk domain-containing protein [Paenibacillus eucommiae]|uniref:Copper amine oxidase-like N-terminal domain-containing protein n=1 Tax=Paenibacillus eucommiae TaxID=1355755 RepID=A0ABS4J4X5_9BACL|nr:stalk domain-containing protein [Paenibacillus eucommiae]MBP1994883.1 hypothetical protein [Paenibacillus eucommiae]
MKKKLIATALGATMLLGTSVGVYAGANLKEIKAYLNGGIQVKYNGSPVQLQDEQGVVVLPITYNGNTYLPVRGIAKTLNVAVDWNVETSTVELGEKAEGVAISTGFSSSNYHTKDPALTTYKDKDYKEVYFDNATASRSSGFMLYPKGKYQKLYLQVAATGKDIEQFSVEDSKNDINLKQETIAIQDGLKTIEIDIGGVEEIFVTASVKADGGMFIPLTTSYYK